MGRPINDIGPDQLFNHIQDFVTSNQAGEGTVANKSQRRQSVQMHIKQKIRRCVGVGANDAIDCIM
jgi:hypothetical protein